MAKSSFAAGAIVHAHIVVGNMKRLVLVASEVKQELYNRLPLVRTIEEIAVRTHWRDFANIKPLFVGVRSDIADEIFRTRRFDRMPKIPRHKLFIIYQWPCKQFMAQ